jgi:hypothetical protein
MSGFFRNIDPPPLTARRVCTPLPLVRGEDKLAGWRGSGGSIVWKTPDTALYSIYVSTLCTARFVGTMVKLRGGNQRESRSGRLHPQLFPVQLFNDDLRLGLLLLILPVKECPKASRVNHALLCLLPPGISK